MTKFRKKPVVIEAFKHTANAGEQTMAWPKWIIDACVDGTIYVKNGDTFIKTLEGDHLVSEGDMIIRGIKGELYPCKPDIFAATYEQVSA